MCASLCGARAGPESCSVAYGTSEVVPSHRPILAQAVQVQRSFVGHLRFAKVPLPQDDKRKTGAVWGVALLLIGWGERGHAAPFNAQWLVIVALIVVVLAMVVLTTPVSVAVVFVVPMSLVQLPAFLVMVIVRVAPVGPFVGRTVPASLDPAVVAAIGGPIPFYPDVTRTGERSTLLVADRRWRGSDVYRNLGRTGGDDSGCEQCAIYAIQFHFVSPS